MCVWKDCCCLSSPTAVEEKFSQAMKCCVQFRPGSMGAENYCPTSGNLAGWSSSCLHPSFSQEECFEPSPNGSLSSYLRGLQRCAIAAAGQLSEKCSGGRNFCHCTLICLPSALARPKPGCSGSDSEQAGLPSHIHLHFHGCVSCAGDRAVPGERSLDVHCSQSGKGRQRVELDQECFCFCMGCVCALLHEAAACRMLLLELATAGNEVWTWMRRDLPCATGWCNDLQPAEDIGKCGTVALTHLRLCYLEDGLFNSLLDLQSMN